MLVGEILSRLGEIGQDITCFNIELGGPPCEQEVINFDELLRLVRHFAGLAKALPHPRIQEAAVGLERDVSAIDVSAVFAFYGDTLAFVDTVKALSANPEMLEQIYSKQFAGETDAPITDLPAVEETVSQIKTQMAEMQNELKAQRKQLAEMKDSDSQAGDKLNPKERQSLQKMILGMALEQYHYEPNARGSAVSHIAGDLREHGLSLDEDTIRKQLRAAAEELLERPVPN